MAPKAHHTVPRLHLQHFAGDEPAGQVWTHDAMTGKNWSKIPLETGTETHFYSLERDDGTHDTRIEEMLSAIESRAASVYRTLLLGDIPKRNTQTRVHFAEFLGMLFVRTSGMRRINAEIYSRGIQAQTYAYSQDQRAFDRLISHLERERGEKIDPAVKEEVQRAMGDPSGYEIEVPKHLTLKALGTADALSPIFYNMKWTLAHPRDGFFITGDNPVVRTTDPTTHHPTMGDGGFKNMTAEVSFPLSTDVILIASWDENARDHGSFERNHVDWLNEIRATSADRFLYAHVNKSWIKALAEKHRDLKPEISTRGFGPSQFATTKVGRR